jgi:general secretion pathway protein K
MAAMRDSRGSRISILRDHDGIALFLVLWVLALLSVIAGEFCHAMRTGVNITRNFKEQTEAYYIAEAGLNRGITEMIRNQFIPIRTVSSAGKEGEGEEKEEKWRFNTDIAPVPFGRGRFKVIIGNESGKVDLNTADDAMLEMILDGFELEETQRSIIVDSILDWRDADDLHRINGAENDYYKGLPGPYECKNGPFDTVDELLMVRGVTPEIFYSGLKDIFTAYGGQGSLQTGGLLRRNLGLEKRPNKININAASPRLLRCLPSMTDELVNRIVKYRKRTDFAILVELLPIVGEEVYTLIVPYLTTEASPYYTIESLGSVEGSNIRQRIETLILLDGRVKRGYRIIQWREGFLDSFGHIKQLTEK